MKPSAEILPQTNSKGTATLWCWANDSTSLEFYFRCREETKSHFRELNILLCDKHFSHILSRPQKKVQPLPDVYHLNSKCNGSLPHVGSQLQHTATYLYLINSGRPQRARCAQEQMPVSWMPTCPRPWSSAPASLKECSPSQGTSQDFQSCTLIHIHKHFTL